MRIASIRSLDISNGENIGVALFTQGCPFHCFNCFNSETWDFKGGELYTPEHEKQILELLKPDHIQRLSILGGEPLIERNIEPLTHLIQEVKKAYPTKKIWLYTGQQYEDVVELYPEIVKLVNVLVDGRYIDSERDHTLKWCGSRNQRVIDIEDTLLNNTVCLHPEC